MIKFWFTLTYIFLAIVARSQVTFTELPLNRQLVGRDLSSNLGTVRIAGTVDFNGVNFQKIHVEVARNGVIIETQHQSLNSNLPTDDFNFTFQITAELSNYTFRVFGMNGTSSSLLSEVTEVVAGDVYIIEGQSNAEAPMRSDNCSQYESPFIRVYAGGIPLENNLIANNNWYYGQGDGNRFSNGNTGQWGLKFAREIVDNLEIPVAIFNGAHGGKSISFFQRPNDYDSSLASNYGRLYYRLKKTGLKDYVRAVFWSQGEQDGFPGVGTTTTSYKDQFMALHDAWLDDYPAVEGIYIFQTRNGCNAPVFDLMEVKEAQRELAMEQVDIQIISTAGLAFFNDNCHYNFVGGYEEFANRLSALVMRDLYGATILPDSDSPLILNAHYIGNNTIEIQTNASQLSGTPLVNEFQLTNAPGVNILDAYCTGSSYFLELDGDPGDSVKISYFGPNPGLSGNHIVNSQGIELVCYHLFPVNVSSPLNVVSNSSQQFSVFPNPASDKLFVEGKNFTEFEIFELSGNVVMKSQAPVQSIAHLPKGIYFVRIPGESDVQISKITIQH